MQESLHVSSDGRPKASFLKHRYRRDGTPLWEGRPLGPGMRISISTDGARVLVK